MLMNLKVQGKVLCNRLNCDDELMCLMGQLFQYLISIDYVGRLKSTGFYRRLNQNRKFQGGGL